ncbi:MAG TPA: TolC family protein [Planctomycetota bacterium]|nr:TolC family protein [Planctomycetota bacterium]
MHRLLVSAPLALALAACTQLPPGNDREATRLDLSQRLHADLPPSPSDLDTACTVEVMALLQAPLSEDNAVRIALLNNHGVRATYERLGIHRADLVQAGLLRNPVFDGDARFLFDGGTELELGLAQPFLDLFYRPLRQRLAEHEFAKAKLLVADELVHLVFAARRAVVNLLAAQHLVAVQQQALSAAVAAHELTIELHAAGNVTDQALAAARVGESAARLDLAAAEQAVAEAREPLQQLLGLWGASTAWTVAGTLGEDPLEGVDTEHVESRAVAASLVLGAGRAAADVAAQSVGLESWRGWLPDGAIGLSALRERGGDWGLGPHLALELPLFDHGTGRQARAEATLREALHQHVQQAVEVRSRARLLRDRLVLLADRLRFSREVHRPLRAEVVRTTLQHYNAMQIGAFDVLRAQQRQLADDREHAVLLHHAWLARLDLLELLAGGLPQHAAPPILAITRDIPTVTEGH